MSDQKKTPNNLKTGLILAAVALVFFLTVVVRRMWMG